MAEISMDYESVNAAALRFANAAGELRETANTLGLAGDNLASSFFVGQGGNAMRLFLTQVQRRIERLAALNDEIVDDLQATLRDFRDQVDPGVAQRFQD